MKLPELTIPMPSHIVNLPPGYIVGVRIRNFKGLEHYASKPEHHRNFVVQHKFVRWQELETYSIRTLIKLFEIGGLFYAYHPASATKKDNPSKR